MRISDWSSDVCSSDLAELMTVIAQGQRLLQAAGKRPELAEMTDPCLVVQRGQPGFGRRPVVAKTQYMRGKARRQPGGGLEHPQPGRSTEERRVGQECVSTGRSRWEPAN